MTFEQIVRDINSKTFAPVYFLQGEESYFIDQISDLIENTILDESEKAFDQTILYGRDVNIPSLVLLAKGFPMIAKYQVIIVKEAQDIKNLAGSKSKSKQKKATNDSLESYLENLSSSTILVFCHKYKSIDSRTSLAKLLKQKGVVFDSAKLRDYQIAGWISSYVKSKSYEISPATSNLLAEYLGNDLSKIKNELEKLFIGLNKGGDITADLIEQNIGISKEYNIFELQKALGTKNMLNVNRIINFYGANPKEHPVQKIISTLFKFFTRTLTYHRLHDKSKNNVIDSLGISAYALDDYVLAARNYTPQKLTQNIRILRDYDMRSKGLGANSSNMPSADMYKELFFKLIY
ncbi:MAG: DNA polymerase III subunit delta [Bacteroidales bacterium]|jgi:DNA polymerase-3 subunit delta|nr:DNA polymerase III subunit delta [Bacteroidales bacterium]